MGALKAGSKATLEVIRNGKRQTLDLTVGAIPDEGKDWQGCKVLSKAATVWACPCRTSDEQKKANDIKGGVIIKDGWDGPAALIGLQPGDVITHLNNQTISRC